jgi:hypothetical protein
MGLIVPRGTRAAGYDQEIDALADGGLEPVRIEDMHDPQMPWPRRWRAEFRRPAGQLPIAAVPG